MDCQTSYAPTPPLAIPLDHGYGEKSLWMLWIWEPYGTTCIIQVGLQLWMVGSLCLPSKGAQSLCAHNLCPFAPGSVAQHHFLVSNVIDEWRTRP